MGEILEPFTQPYLVEGWMRGSHNGPIMPVSVEDSTPTRFDGPPRVTALGFQLSNGMLIGPRDMFKDKSFDNARQKSLDMADMMRSHGPFEPHRLPLEEMEYTTMPQVSKKLAGRFKPLKD
ncbi:fructose 1,6-bisphosphatase [Dehalococcoides mccartyi]|uniref:Fructose-1,6-bisphosphate aldolase/phosphatase n=1 Tax=Dehalococcoides mccartyi TaxID=61435 RepID=A0A2J1DWH0_9CHLR|nr:fructose 1,6-bisphosphatase [Dehalococcoides mccartyi]